MIYIIDFGSQTTHLIARRLKELGSLTSIVSPQDALQAIEKEKPQGIVLSGGPSSVYEEGAPTIDPAIFSCGVPMLAICYGLQLTAHLLGGKVVPGRKEFGPAKLRIKNHESRIMNQEEAIASLSAALSALSEVEGSTSSTSGMLSPDMLMGIDLDVHNATMSGTLAVLGKTLLSDLTVTGEIVTGLLRIDGLSSEIHTLVGPLKLQENGLNGIELFAGLMTIDPTGDITTEGILAAKEVKAEKLTIVETAQASGSAVLASSVGTVTIPAGETSIDVQTTALTADSLIFVTPQRAVAAGAKRLNSNTFTITLEQAPVSNLKVQWWIIN